MGKYFHAHTCFQHLLKSISRLKMLPISVKIVKSLEEINYHKRNKDA